MSSEMSDRQGEPGEGLERRYRRLLRVLPKPYREARAEELLSVLMDGAGQGRRWPEAREVFGMARLGVRVRMGREGRPVLEDTRVAAMARVVGITGTVLLAFVGAGTFTLVLGNLIRGHLVVWTYWHPFTWKIAHVQSSSFSIGRSIVTYAVPAGWLPVLGLLVLGWWRVARLAALALFLGSAYLTDGTETILREETVLAGVVTAALFAVRGAPARRVRLAGSVAFAVVLGIADWTHNGGPGVPMRAITALQGYGATDERHALVMAAAGVVVVGVVAYRSVVWPVALAVVAAAALGPVLVRAWVHPDYQGSDLLPLAFLTGALIVVAALAVVRDRLVARRARPGSEPAALG